MPNAGGQLIWYTAFLLAVAVPAVAQTLEATQPKHGLGGTGGGPAVGLDVGPWPARGLPRPFDEVPASPILARLPGPALINAGRVDNELTRACRAGTLKLPQPRSRAVVGEKTYVAARGRDLPRARSGAAGNALYIFQYADANRCTVWEAGARQR